MKKFVFSQNYDFSLFELEEELPKFLGSVAWPRLAFYNAGTDILMGDPLCWRVKSMLVAKMGEGVV